MLEPSCDEVPQLFSTTQPRLRCKSKCSSRRATLKLAQRTPRAVKRPRLALAGQLGSSQPPAGIVLSSPHEKEACSGIF